MRILFFLLAILLSTHSFAQKKLTSGGVLKPEQANMDIRHYTIGLDVNIDRKYITGYTTIDFITAQPANVLIFDLLDSFNIKSVKVNKKEQPYIYKDDLIRINMPALLPAGKASVSIEFEGRPLVAVRPPWEDGFTWAKDSTGKPWVAITAAGTGGKTFFACKDHPSDEPDDGAALIITVPKGLVVAGPGLLKNVTSKNNKTTFTWETNYPINNYSILFNIGKYKVVSRNYTTINGNTVPIQFYVLEQHVGKAEHHLDIMERIIKNREKYFGEYPWVKEKIGIVETPHLGMEHQTMNAYGNQFRYTKVGGQDFDWLLDHEFGHEWWGNKVTAKDWAHYWIHEGIGSYGDVLYLREMEGEEAYLKRFRQMALGFENKKPIVQGTDIDEQAAYISDIYGKGAFFMHTLRYVIGDSIFFPALKGFVTDPKNMLTTTDDAEQYFTKRSGTNLKPLFDLFLRTPDKLEISVKRSRDETWKVSLLNLDLAVPLKIITGKGTETIQASKKAVTVKSTTVPAIDPDMYYFSKVIIE